jgi:lipopolysaccharide transport system permease protein
MKSHQDLAPWSLVIEPSHKFLDLSIKDLWHYRDLILLFVKRDFATNYKQTILGPLWFIIQPLLTTITFTIVFSNIAHIPTNNVPQPLFYMVGIVAWNFFSQSFTGTSNTFIMNAGIFSKVYFPRLTVPLSIILSNLLTFSLQFAFMLAFLIYFMAKGAPVHPSTQIIMLPLLICMIAMLGFGFGLIFSSLTTKYRDLTYLLSFGILLWMYATPIVYPLSNVPKEYLGLSLANPMTSIIESFRTVILSSGIIPFGGLAYSFVFSLVILILGVAIFSRTEKSFMDTV